MKYKYINIENDGGKAKIRLSTIFTSHRKIIDEYAQDGYKYVGYIPTAQTGSGLVVAMDLIFEKNESSKN